MVICLRFHAERVHWNIVSLSKTHHDHQVNTVSKVLLDIAATSVYLRQLLVRKRHQGLKRISLVNEERYTKQRFVFLDDSRTI